MIECRIHQSWKTGVLPPAYALLARGWKDKHPGWSYRLWTDEDLRSFVARDYPQFLAMFDGYQSNICRFDLARYLILRTHGGVFADLDAECLRPFDDLLAGRSLVIGLEPEEHLDDDKPRSRGLTRLVCPTIMAAEPNHPFWDHVLALACTMRDAPDPLDATGPFLLTRAWETYSRRDEIALLPPSAFYPVTKQECWNGRMFDLSFRERVTRTAHALHYWHGTWWRGAEGGASLAEHPALPANFVVRGRFVPPSEPACEPAPPPAMGEEALISCLMVTQEKRLPTARLAMESFRRQIYPNRELVVMTDGPHEGLKAAIAELDDPRIRLVPAAEGLTLGALRNLSVEAARGEFVCQWDDDDLSDPLRLLVQMAVMRAHRASCVFLDQVVIWWPEQERLALSVKRCWEGTMLCRRDIMPRYPELRRGEDTPLTEAVLRHHGAVFLPFPRLYLYIAHGRNTFGTDHFDRLWSMAEERFSEERTAVLLEDLDHHMPVARYAEATGRRPIRPTVKVMPEAEEIVVLTPMKQARAFLDSYDRLVRAIDHPRDRLALGILVGDSDDGTWEAVEALRPSWERVFRRVTLLRRDHGLRLDGPRWLPQHQRARRSVLARARNYLLAQALGDAEWALWLDADVIEAPPDALRRMIAAGRPVVTPNCVLDPGGPSFDLNCFRFTDRAAAENPRHLVDGLFQPPRGLGRTYLDALRGEELVQVDSVGATMLLVRADLHREGAVFPPAPVRGGYIETEGFAMTAADMGAVCWALPDLEIRHARI